MKRTLIAKIYSVLSIATACLWLILSMMSVGSLFLEMPGSFVNLLMGLIFFVMGVFFFLRACYFSRFFLAFASSGRINNALLKYVYLDIVFVFLSFLFVSLLNSGAASRVFGEGLPIFG